MEVRSDRRYDFAQAPDELWQALTRVDDYRRWWPWLRRFDAAAFAPGERWRCVVQPPLPYALRFDLTLDEVEPGAHAVATISGDLRGHARLDLTPVGEGSQVRLVSTLAPASSMLQLAARVARPVVRMGHDWVLDTGLRQFAARALDGR